jgi:nucleoside-diphosphate-sugar epimerase
MSKNKNLVLGGSGAIGTHLCQYLLEKGEEVINLDLKNGFDLRNGDMSMYRDVDFVWFLAWDVGGSKYLTDKDNHVNILRNNTRICNTVFSFLEETRIPFLFTSSQLAESDNVYGITKLLGEEWTRALNGKIVKFWNVYAWEEPGIRSHIIPDIILTALTTGDIKLLTTGEEQRQFIYVVDCIRNLVQLRGMETMEVHLTNGRWYSIKEVADIVAAKLNACVTTGTQKGYNNKVEPNESGKLFTYPTTLEQGIEFIIEKTRDHLASGNIL